jgi:hypothetical protein
MVSGAWWSPEALLGERRGDRLLLREKGGNEKKKSMNQLKVRGRLRSDGRGRRQKLKVFGWGERAAALF